MLVVDLVETIEKAFEEKPEGRKRKEVSEWKTKINSLIDKVNQLSKIKMYKPQ